MIVSAYFTKGTGFDQLGASGSGLNPIRSASTEGGLPENRSNQPPVFLEIGRSSLNGLELRAARGANERMHG